MHECFVSFLLGIVKALVRQNALRCLAGRFGESWVGRPPFDGPRLTTWVGYLKGACHLSFSSIRKFLRDVVKVTISRGQLRKLIAKVSDSLADPYEELLKMLPQEDRLNVDETPVVPR